MTPTSVEDTDQVQTATPEEEAKQAKTEALAESIRSRLLAHLKTLGVNGEKRNLDTKAAIRASHMHQREELRKREAAFVQKYGNGLLMKYFADGTQLEPTAVRPVLRQVVGTGEDARLFRFSTLLWSVPVSRGFGRRMRFLVFDENNSKLMGLFALCDPVFNLRARDSWIGWDVEDRRERLVNTMDAYVVGAVPPYSHLIGAKVIAALMTSHDVTSAFEEKYRDSKGIISGRKKEAKLALITVTSALGRSSLYNRLRIPDLFEFTHIGATGGWGHFHVPDDIFNDMRGLLELSGHKYASGHQYGQGPNWRMRVVRQALKQLGLNEDFLRHGIAREVYVAPLANNARKWLRGEDNECEIDRPTADEIGRRSVDRWLIPRAESRPEYQEWARVDTWNQIWPEDLPGERKNGQLKLFDQDVA